MKRELKCPPESDSLPSSPSSPRAAWMYWLLGACAVISFLKAGISLLHLITASKNMAAIDVAEREAKAKAQ